MSCIAAEEMNRVCAGIAGTLVVCAISCNAIYDFGTEAQKQRWLKPVMEGHKIAGIGMTEPDVGSDFKAIKTRARKVDGGWVINGTKTFITNGPIADFIVVCCRTDDSQSHKGISLLVVEKDTPGYTVTKKLKKLGLHSSETGELLFEDCFVPDEHLIGEEGKGFYHVMKNLSMERLWSGAGSLGIAVAALDAALRYAKERVQFGQPIGKFQMVRKLLVDMQTKVDAARHLVYTAALRIDRGEDPVMQVSQAKMYASEIAKEVATDALQIFGGNGFMMEFPVQRYLRDAQVGTIYAGTNQIMTEIIADRMGL
jgi:alkylation response protein AidB-like acyl-CoA dehydrogenase